MKYIPLPSTATRITCFSSEADKYAAYAQIQADIATLNHAMMEIKTSHNSLNITARLPDEILAYIFAYNVSMDINLPTWPLWIQVAGVCKAWRRVALACPWLWNYTRHSGIDWVSRMVIPRSGQVPLRIILRDNHLLEGVSMLLVEMHRIQHLEFYVNCDLFGEAEQTFLTRLAQPAPLIESFKAETTSNSVSTQSPGLNLFGDYAPKLRIFHLCGFTIPPRSPIMAGLTEFKFCPSQSILVSHLMSLLAVAPNLVTLEICQACYIVDTMATIRIDLPHLELLRIDDSAATSTSILSCIVHPSTTNLNITITSQPDGVDSIAIPALAQELAAHIPSIDSLSIALPGSRTLSMTHSQADRPQIAISLYRGADIQAFIQSLPLQHLQVIRLCDTFSSWLIGIIPNVSCLHTISVRHSAWTLFETLFDGISKDELASAMRLHDDSIHKELGNTRRLGLLHCASQKKEHHPFPPPRCGGLDYESSKVGRNPGPLCFPSLKSLEIDEWHAPVFECDVAVLAAILRVRANRGLALEKLRVQYLVETEHQCLNDYLEIIRGVVKSSDWYGSNGVVLG